MSSRIRALAVALGVAGLAATTLTAPPSAQAWPAPIPMPNERPIDPYAYTIPMRTTPPPGSRLAELRWVAPARAKTIYLTFDDGPSRYTPQVLAVLKRYGARATFCQLGRSRAAYPRYTTAVIRAGHKICNHTVSHPSLPSLSTNGVRWQVARGPASRCVRPPYGATSTRVRTTIYAMRRVQLLWDVDTEDWRRPGSSAIARRIIAGAHNGAVILMHDGGGNRSQTVAGLSTALSVLKARGWRFAPLACS